MFERWYEIKGITPEMYEQWKEYMRPEFLIWKENNIIRVSLLLSWAEAIRWRKLIERNNKIQNDYVLGLVRV